MQCFSPQGIGSAFMAKSVIDMAMVGWFTRFWLAKMGHKPKAQALISIS
jgi:hypothetical protein